jgi:hypothetical protein
VKQRNLFNQLVNVFVPHMVSEGERRSILQTAFFGNPLLNKIDYSGAAHDFCVELVQKLWNYGEIESGKLAIVAALEEITNLVGTDQHPTINRLILETQNILQPKKPSRVHDVFLSYKREDGQLMQSIRSILISSGISVWTDDNIEPGTVVWMSSIQTAIEQCGCVVVLLSPEAKASEWIQKELHYAVIHKKKIFPVLVRGDAVSSLSIEVASRQYIDISVNTTAIEKELVPTVCEYLGIVSVTQIRRELEIERTALLAERERISELERQLAKPSVKDTTQTKHLKQQLLKFEEENRQLKGRMAEVLPDIEALNSEWNKQYEEEKAKNAKLTEELGKMEKEYYELQDEMFELGSQLEEVNNEVERLQIEIDVLQRTVNIPDTTDYVKKIPLLESSPEELQQAQEIWRYHPLNWLRLWYAMFWQPVYWAKMQNELSADYLANLSVMVAGIIIIIPSLISILGVGFEPEDIVWYSHGIEVDVLPFLMVLNIGFVLFLFWVCVCL